MSIQNFASGLGNDLMDQATKDVTGFAMDKTDIFKQNKISNNEFLGEEKDIPNITPDRSKKKNHK